MFFVFPETSGKTLEEVEELFLVGVPAWKTRVDYRGVVRAEREGLGIGEKKLEGAAVVHEESRTGTA